MTSAACVEIRIRGTVQGVGFRPAVWTLANALGLTGDVLNDGEGVCVRLKSTWDEAAHFAEQVQHNAPPLARIEGVELQSYAVLPVDFPEAGFHIAASKDSTARTRVAVDAATCPACLEEVRSPFERRFRYPFTNCTHCGPRLSIIARIPYDRANTTMADFILCEACASEYHNPADRRFHAQPIACHACGPRARLERLDGKPFHFDQFSMLDEVDAVATLIQRGQIVAIKGMGGYQLCCDATSSQAVAELRQRKQRDRKPFALMARDLDVIRRYCRVTEEEQRLLASAEAPIVLLEAAGESLPETIAPGLKHLGFMLPNTPLHHLMLRRVHKPVVMTSGNLSDEPQVVDDDSAREKLAGIADYIMLHNRGIANRLDDSVVRVMCNTPRVLRRARGYAPASIALPEDFASVPEVLACGGELKSVFGLVQQGAVVLSQHQGDLEHVAAFDDYEHNLALYTQLFQHAPAAIAVDAHPDYLSTKLGKKRAAELAVPLVEVQHHHAHVASCMVENGWRRDQGRVLGVALDGLGYGLDGTLWGGEFLLADYNGFERVGTFKPVPMLGGVQAIREPWRNTYAHLMAEIGWAELAMNFAELELFGDLSRRPRQQLDAIMGNRSYAPLASSCGRLFDAVGAALGLAREHAGYEGEAAALLEAAVDRDVLENEDELLAYPFSIPNLKGSGLPYIEPIAMWRALLGDLIIDTPVGVMAARFHKGLAKAITTMVQKLCQHYTVDGEAPTNTVALSGGCFHNAVLLEMTVLCLERHGFHVLTQSRVPSGDGGLALGQAAIVAARLMITRNSCR